MIPTKVNGIAKKMMNGSVSYTHLFKKGGRTLNLLATLNVVLAVVVTTVIYFCLLYTSRCV